MKLTHKKVATLAATLITFGSLAGGANGALFLNAFEVNGNTVVTLTGQNFDLAGLTTSTETDSLSTFINPSSQTAVAFTGSRDTFTAFENAHVIPSFNIGTGGLDSAATQLGASNPFIALGGSDGLLLTDNANPLPSDFFATATYSGTFVDNGIDITPQTFTLSNGQQLFVFPEPSSALLLSLATFGFAVRRRRTN